MNIFIGCGYNNKIPKKYFDDCKNYLNILLKDNNLVFGASATGLMGLSYNIAKMNGNKVHGICPEQFEDDLCILNCDENELSRDISERTKSLVDSSDALVFLPGGIGTIYEFFYALESKRVGEFNKPIIIYNSCGYYDKLKKLFKELYIEHFVNDSDLYNIHFSNTIEDTLDYIENYRKAKTLIKVR